MEANARHMCMPGQLKVLGYGDVNFAAHTDPPLTTIRTNGQRIGELAALTLIQGLKRKTLRPRSWTSASN
jgi:LacI family gluconate utilization system Gnt-I transcriptional repressor